MSIRPDDWARVRDVFERALAVPAPQRRAFVATVCSDDAVLREEVEQLLDSHERAAVFLETPVRLASIDSTMAALTGQQLGPYQLGACIGTGGMGAVFKAYDTRLDRTVAIKVLSASSSQARARFEREARAIAALNHPHICTLYDVGEAHHTDTIGSEPIRFLVMEFVDGTTLGRAEAPLACTRVAHIAAQVCDALDTAHARGIVHRDIKPLNLMLTPEGSVKVLDFGIATLDPRTSDTRAGTQLGSLTETGLIVGTLRYMSPEQVCGAPASAASDIFSLGLVLYELLTGQHPFSADESQAQSQALIQAMLVQTPAPPARHNPEIPTPLADAILKMLEKDPARRPSAAEVRDFMTDWARSLQVHEKSQGSSAWMAAREPTAAATAAPHRTRYVSRASEHAQLRRFLDHAIAGHGGLVLISGEPGVGKTRLAEEILRDATGRGCVALIGRCYEQEGMPPFIPWVEIVEEAVRTRPRAVFRSALGDTAPEVAKIVPELRQLFLDIPPAIELPPEQHRRYLFNSFLSFLERAASSTTHVLLIDDLHWADESTLSLLRHIAQRIAQVPMLIVATYRDDELDSTRPFAKTLEALMRQRLAHRFPLHRLAEDGVRNMLTALSNQDVPDAVVRTLFRATEGNPFFVEEMFHDLVEEGLLFGGGGQWRTALQTDSIDVPESIRLVISRRAERLNGAARRILATIAVIGRSFDLALLSELCDSDLEQWLTGLEEAQAAKLVLSVAAGRDVRWEFAHGLIRQTLESQLPAARRQRAHLRIAEAMERAYSTRLERHASEIARHLYQAGAAAPEDKTTRFLILAGDLALEARAFDEALRQFDNALSIQDEQQVRSVAALRYKKGTALRSLGRGDEALEEWHRALATYEALGDVESIAHTLYDVVWETSWRPPGSAILRGLSPIQAAKSIAQRGLELVESGDAVHGRLLALMAVWSARAGDDFRTSLDLLQEAEALGARLQQPRLTMELLDARMHIHYAYMQLPQTVEIGRAAVGMRHERGELYDACDNYWAIMLASFTMGRLKEALDVSQTLEALATRVGHLPGRWNVRVVRTLVELVTSGDLVRSETMARADMEAAAVTNPVWRSFNHLTIGLMRFFAGDWPMARSEFDAAVRHDPKSFTDGVFPSAWLLAQTYAGDAEALGRLKESASSLITLTEENPHGVWERLQNVVEGLAVLRQARDAAALYPLVLKAIEKGAAISYGVRLWQMVAGIAAAAGGHIDAARAHFETALRQADELPHRIAQPEIRRWYGQMMLDTGADSDRDRARVLLAEALGMYQALGMPRHVEMAAAGLH